MIRKTRGYKIFICILFVILFVVTFIILYVQPPRKQWTFCFYQFSQDILQNNAYLKEKNAGLDVSCPMQEETIQRAENCFNDVANMNFFSRYLLLGRPVRELERIKSLHTTECGPLNKK